MAERIKFKDYFYLQGDNVHITGSGGLKVPDGNNSQKPTNMESVIRYNSELDQFELGISNETIVLNTRTDGSSSFYSKYGGQLGGDLVMQDQRILADTGTAQQPSYTFYNDLDTGIFHPSQDNISIIVGGTTNSTPAMEIFRTGTGNTDQNVVINGNLIVEGTSTSVNSTNLNVEDNTITLNKNGTSAGLSGIEIEADSLIAASFRYNFSTSKWSVNNSTISDVINPVDNLDVTNKIYVDTELQAVEDALQDQIGDLNNLTTLDKTNLVSAINELDGELGDLSTLTTSDKTTLVNATNEVQLEIENEVTRATNAEANLQNQIGTLSNLTTLDKTNLVSAINELDSELGDLSTLTTSNKTTLVGATNEVQSEIIAEETRATNAEANLQSQIGTLSNLTTADKTNLVSAINELDGDVGDLSTLSTSNTTSIVLAVNEVQSEIIAEETRATNAEANLQSQIGNLTSLTTTDKSTLVAAIVEVDTDVGNKSNLTTTDKTNLVNAINELDSDIGTLGSLSTTDKTNLVAATNEVQLEIENEVTRATNAEANLQSQIDLKEDKANKGVPDGYASLDSGGKVPTSQLPDSAFGGLEYLGTWDAVTNTPTLTSGSGTRGHYYKVNNADSNPANNTTLDGTNDWGVGDWVIFNGSSWEKIDQTEQVLSVNGQTGNVTLTLQSVGATSYGETLAQATSDANARSILNLGTVATYDTGSTVGTIPVRTTNGDLTGDLQGNANTATALETSSTLTFDGDVSGTITTNLAGNETITLTVLDDSHTHDTRYYTQTQIDSNFVNVAGDTMTGALTTPTLNLDAGGATSASIGQASGYLSGYVDSGSGLTEIVRFSNGQGEINVTGTWETIYHTANLDPSLYFEKSGGTITGRTYFTDSIRANKGAPSGGDASTVGYAFEEDGNTGLFAEGGTAQDGSDLVLRIDGNVAVRYTATAPSTMLTGYEIESGADRPLKLITAISGEGWIVRHDSEDLGFYNDSTTSTYNHNGNTTTANTVTYNNKINFNSSGEIQARAFLPGNLRDNRVVVDVDAIDLDGKYSVTNTSSGTKPLNYVFGLLNVEREFDGVITQRFTGLADTSTKDDNRIFIRTYRGGVWTEWVEIQTMPAGRGYKVAGVGISGNGGAWGISKSQIIPDSLANNYDLRDVIVDVKVLDNDTNSPTYNMWIDASAVATYGITNALDAVYVYNNYSTALTFHIRIHI